MNCRQNISRFFGTALLALMIPSTMFVGDRKPEPEKQEAGATADSGTLTFRVPVQISAFQPSCKGSDRRSPRRLRQPMSSSIVSMCARSPLHLHPSVPS